MSAFFIHANVRVVIFTRDGASGELKYTLEGHAMGVISVDASVDGTRECKSRWGRVQKS